MYQPEEPAVKIPKEMAVLKIIESSVTGLPSSYKFPRRVLRVVRVQRPEQKGWLSEKGVSLVWESSHYDPRSRGPKSNYQKLMAKAEEVLEDAKVFGE
jgi:hypothetical protein